MRMKAVDISKSNYSGGLLFVPLDVDSIRLGVFEDAIFASNKDNNSHLGFLVALADKTNSANIIPYSSFKAKRVTRSVLVADLFSLVHAFNFLSTLRMKLIGMFGRDIAMVLYTDSKSLYDGIVAINSTKEKLLLIDITDLREAYELREIADVSWIPSGDNPADALTKLSASPTLSKLMAENKLSILVKSWVERTHTCWSNLPPIA